MVDRVAHQAMDWGPECVYWTWGAEGVFVDFPAARIRCAGLGHRSVVRRHGEHSAAFAMPAWKTASSQCTPSPRPAVRRRLLRRNRLPRFVPVLRDRQLYLNYLAHFVKPGGRIGMAGAGLVREVDVIPEHFEPMWTQDFWAIHSAEWCRRHWERTGIVEVEVADTMPDGWRRWLEWQRVVAPDNAAEINAVEIDAGRYLGYVRLVSRRRG